MNTSTIILLVLFIISVLINNKIIHYIITPIISIWILYIASWGIFNLPYWLYTKYQIHDLIFAICLLIALPIYYHYLRKWTISSVVFINRNHLKVAKVSLIISYILGILYCILTIILNFNMHLICWVCCITSIISYTKTLLGSLTLKTD